MLIGFLHLREVGVVVLVSVVVVVLVGSACWSWVHRLGRSAAEGGEHVAQPGLFSGLGVVKTTERKTLCC